MLRTAARASALCTLVVVCQPDVWNSESCFLQVNYDLAEHDTSATAVAAGNGSQSAHGHFQGLQSDTKGLSRTAATADAKSLTQGKQNVSSIGSAPATLNATTRDFLSTARHECMLFFGVPKFYWAVLCDALGIAMLLLCIPCLLQCSRRRSVGASIFDFGFDRQPLLKPPPFTGHVRAGLTSDRET